MEINNFDKLVKIVTASILKNSSLNIDSRMHDKSCLILIPNIGLGFEEYFDYIMKKYSDYNLYLGSDEELSKMHYVEANRRISFIPLDVRNRDFLYLLESVETVVVLGLKIEQMKSLTENNDTDDVNHIIINSLMANKTINIMINSNEYMLNKITSIISDLKNMGIEVSNIQKRIDTVLERTKLITESYVQNLKGSGMKVLHLDQKQLITPLAKDKLREYNIKIEYIKEAK